jgi:hypothetical protein
MRMLGTLSDISPRKAAEQLAAQLQARLQDALRVPRDGTPP